MSETKTAIALFVCVGLLAAILTIIFFGLPSSNPGVAAPVTAVPDAEPPKTYAVRLGRNVWRIDDAERGVTCWILISTRDFGGISCLPMTPGEP